MLGAEDKGKIWSLLKKEPLDAHTISVILDLDDDIIVSHYLKEQVKDGFLIEDDGIFYIKIRLDSPFNVEERRALKNYEYGNVRAQMGPVTDFPRKWTNPLEDRLPSQVDQGSRGTCVGLSTCTGVTLLHIMKLAKEGKPIPSDEDLKNIKREVKEKPFGLTCTIIHDVFYPWWISGGFNYWNARDMAHATYPVGSYLIDWIKAAHKRGCIHEEDFWTSLTNSCAPDFFPWEWQGKSRDELLKKAEKYKIEGYAQTTDFETFCRMIYEQGCAWVDVNIYENYQKGGCKGIYPEPKGSVIGSHAQVAIGYDLDAGIIIFKQTWGKNWSNLGGISRNYWNKAAGLGLCAIGVNMVEVAQKLYTKIVFESNVDATFYLDDNKVENKVVVERNTKHCVRAVPKIMYSTKEKEMFQEFEAINEEYIVNFKFTSSTLGDYIKLKIEEIFKKIFGGKR